MESLYATSRAIDQDKFRQKQLKRKYSQHIHKIQDIVNEKAHPILQQVREIKKMQTNRKKAQEMARNFREEQNNQIRKRENRLLLQRIWNVNSDCKKFNEESCKYLSGSNWYYKKKRAESIKQQNKKMIEHLSIKKPDAKEYKKKMDNQIKDYLQLRDQIRKFKFSSVNKSQKKLRHSKSEAKNLNKVKSGSEQEPKKSSQGYTKQNQQQQKNPENSQSIKQQIEDILDEIQAE